MENDGFFNRIRNEYSTFSWINSAIIDEIDASIQMGAIGCTSNPTHPPRAVKRNPEIWIPVIDQIIKDNPIASYEELVDLFTQKLIKTISNKFLPIYNDSNHQYGYCAGQGNPFYIDNSKAMIDYAITYRKINDNVIAKIPSSLAGLEAVEQLTSQGINTVCTMGFSTSQNIAFAEAFKRGLSNLNDSANNPKCFVVIIPGIFDDYLQEKAKLLNIFDLSQDALRYAGAAIVRKSYNELSKRGLEALLFVGGTRNIYHITDYIGKNVHITHSFNTWKQLFETNPSVTNSIDNEISGKIIDELLEKFDDFRYAYELNALQPVDFENFGPCLKFNNSCKEGFITLMNIIKDRREHI